MNPIAAKNNTIVTLHLDDEECGSKRLLKDEVWHQVDDSTTIDEHPRDRLPIDVP
jgi:hypothetical protein